MGETGHCSWAEEVVEEEQNFLTLETAVEVEAAQKEASRTALHTFLGLGVEKESEEHRKVVGKTEGIPVHGWPSRVLVEGAMVVQNLPSVYREEAES